jgi:hypothetical protein
MMTLLSKAKDFILGKGRLIIEYTLIGIVITLCGTASALWLAKQRTALQLAQTETRLGKAETRITVVEGVNQAHEETINDLKQLRSKDAQAIDGLIGDYKDLASKDDHAKARLKNLENTNATVKTYLNQPVPTQLACVLNNTCKPTDKSSDTGSASAPTDKPH